MRDLTVWNIHLLGDGLKSEGRTLELAFRPWIEAGVVRLVASRPAEVLARVEAEFTSAEMDLAWISAGTAAPEGPVSPWACGRSRRGPSSSGIREPRTPWARHLA